MFRDAKRVSQARGRRERDRRESFDSPVLSRRPGGRREEEVSGAEGGGYGESGCFFCRGFLVVGLDDALVIG